MKRFFVSLLLLCSTLIVNAAQQSSANPQHHDLRGVIVEKPDPMVELMKHTNTLLHLANNLQVAQNEQLKRIADAVIESSEDDVKLARFTNNTCSVIMKTGKNVLVWSKDRLNDAFILGKILCFAAQTKWNDRNKKRQ